MNWFGTIKENRLRRLWLGGLAAGLLLVAGFGLAGLAAGGIIPNISFVGSFTMNISGMSSRAGILFAVIAFGLAAIAEMMHWQRSQIQQREQATHEESRQRFLQRLDHELKNPLTILRLGIANVQQSHLNDEQENSLMRMDEQVQRLQKLVTDLRLLTELSESRIESKSLELKDVLEESIHLACAVDNRREVSLTVQDTPWPLSPVWGDYDLLVLAFRNLLENALKFTQPTDRVAVRAVEDGRSVIVEVADTGMGILPDELALVFEELYRGQNARGVPGSGLGLKLVERIVTLHGGEVGVRSRPEKGTVFTVRLPLK